MVLVTVAALSSNAGLGDPNRAILLRGGRARSAAVVARRMCGKIST
jgi:hypothetical protein